MPSGLVRFLLQNDPQAVQQLKSIAPIRVETRWSNGKYRMAVEQRFKNIFAMQAGAAGIDVTDAAAIGPEISWIAAAILYFADQGSMMGTTMRSFRVGASLRVGANDGTVVAVAELSAVTHHISVASGAATAAVDVSGKAANFVKLELLKLFLSQEK